MYNNMYNENAQSLTIEIKKKQFTQDLETFKSRIDSLRAYFKCEPLDELFEKLHKIILLYNEKNAFLLVEIEQQFEWLETNIENFEAEQKKIKNTNSQSTIKETSVKEAKKTYLGGFGLLDKKSTDSTQKGNTETHQSSKVQHK